MNSLLTAGSWTGSDDTSSGTGADRETTVSASLNDWGANGFYLPFDPAQTSQAFNSNSLYLETGTL